MAVALQDVKAPVFKALLHFAYTDALPEDLEGAWAGLLVVGRACGGLGGWLGFLYTGRSEITAGCCL